MANWDTPKSTGEYVGEVLQINGNTLRVRLKPGVVLHNGDGLTMGNEGFNVNGVEGNWVKVNKELTSISSLKGRGLYRNLDVEFVKNLRSERKIPVDVVSCDFAPVCRPEVRLTAEWPTEMWLNMLIP